MVLLNGQPFHLRADDTKEMILARIALRLKTHPKLLVFPSGLELDEKTDINAVDFYQSILQGVETSKFSFYDTLPITLRGQLGYSREEIFREWLRLISLKGGFERDFEDIINIVYADLLGNFSIEEFLREGKSIKNEITSFLQEQSALEAKFDDFNQMTSVITTRFSIAKITVEIPFSTDYDLMELFDLCKVSNFIPYLNIQNFHKAHQSLKNIPEEWTGSLPDMLRFFIRHTESGNDYDKHYSEGIINSEDGIYKISLETPIEAQSNSQFLIKRIFECFNLSPPDFKQIREKSLNSVFYIPSQRFSSVLFRDLIMNNPLLSSMCYSDESARLGRFRTGLSFFYHPLNLAQKITVSMIEGISDAKDFQKDQLNFPVNSIYVKVRVNHAPNQKIAEDLMRFVGKMFTIYNQEEPGMIAFYQKYLPESFEFKKELDTVKVGGNRLQDLLPTIFQSGYPRSCQHPPILLRDLPPEPYQGNYIVRHPTYREAILFPKSKEEGPQNWFVCEEGYPGLKKSNLANSNVFPYLPCCYKTSQVGKKNMIAYYQNITREDEKVFTHILKTPKILLENELGYLPNDIVTLFKLTIPIEISFFRKGVPRSQHVFFHAVAKATQKNFSRSMLTDQILLFDRQSNFRQTIPELQQEIDSNTYLDPRKYLRSAEELFDCSIFIFTREGNEAKLVLPYYEHFYTSFPKTKPAVLILEHSGTESDVAEYPQCELIVAGDKSSQMALFSKEITAILENAQRKITSFHLIDNPYKLPPSEDQLPSGIIGQFIDDFGKMRGVQIQYKSKKINLLCGPMPIIHAPRLTSYSNNEIELVREYISEKGWKTLREENGYIYIETKEGYIYYFPIKIDQRSNYMSTIQAKRTARLLSEHALYTFSKFCFEQKLPYDEKALDRFFAEKIIIPDKLPFAYPPIQRKFEKSSWIKDGKLILNSENLIPGIRYHIYLCMLRNISNVINYRHQVFFKNFFLEKSDFLKTNTDLNAVLFSDGSELLDWSDSEPSKIKMSNFPRYLGSVYLLETNVGKFLCQPAYSYENAVAIYRQWKDDQTPIVIMVFINPDKLELLSQGKPNILAWKQDNVLYYNAILG